MSVSHSQCVVAAHPEAARAGWKMLQSGGNAIDAACAAAWALGVCEPGESGLGGQTTLLLRLKDGSCRVIDGHSRAPESLTRSNVKTKAQDRGLTATTIPSTPATLEYLQKKFGRLSTSAALQPAITLAFEGYTISKLQRRLLKWTAPHFQLGSPEVALFLDHGQPYKEGATFRQKFLGKTLERIAARGTEDFYSGEIARELIRDMEERGGLISSTDLNSLALPVERQPLEIEYRGLRVMSLPPPGGGVQLLLALKLLEKLWGATEPLEALALAQLQAVRASFRERERWPDHPTNMTDTLRQWLLSDARVEAVLKAMPSMTDLNDTPDTMGEDGNTTHLCTADSEGNVVSLTQSIQSVFGAKVAHPTLGFVYNNYLSTCPRSSHPYQLRGGALPQSNASPTLVFRGEMPILALGSAGSRRITSSIVTVLSAVIDRGEGLQTAIARPRVHPLLDGKLWLEKSVPESDPVLIGMKSKSVRSFSDLNYKFGAIQALSIANGVIIGAADPRRDGEKIP